jgi:hypothetical protein
VTSDHPCCSMISVMRSACGFLRLASLGSSRLCCSTRAEATEGVTAAEPFPPYRHEVPTVHVDDDDDPTLVDPAPPKGPKDAPVLVLAAPRPRAARVPHHALQPRAEQHGRVVPGRLQADRATWYGTDATSCVLLDPDAGDGQSTWCCQ